jgi:hypothetical protein
MANWFPLIINTGSSQIQELPSGQNLDLSNSNISNVAAITVTNTGTAIVNGASSGSGNIGATGATFNTVFARATTAAYADLAEKYSADADYEPGTVVMFGGSSEVTQCNHDMCSAVAGIISTQPAYLMNTELEHKHVAVLALLGRVPCRVQGPVKTGDLMVSAGNGRARSETSPASGTIIGKAVQSFTGDIGVVEVAIGIR